jgi:hypothetical protein
MGCLAALNRFVSRLGEHMLHLYKLLKKSDSIRWIEGAEKVLVTKLPVLASLEPGETLLL